MRQKDQATVLEKSCDHVLSIFQEEIQNAAECFATFKLLSKCGIRQMQ